MGYRQKYDGSWEQPLEAESRLKKRSIRNFTAATLLSATVAGSVAFGVSLWVDSNVLNKGQTDYEKIAGGVLLLVFGAAAGTLGSVPLATSINRTERSLNAVRKDIRDGVEVIDKGVAIRPEEKVFLGLA